MVVILGCGRDTRHAGPFFNWRVEHRGRARYRSFNRKVEQGVTVDDQLNRVFSALADPIRRDMVARLAVADAGVNELAEPYDVSLQAVSKHLKVLEEAGLVSRTRQAQRRPVHLEAEVFDLMTKWIERYRRQAEERYRRLDDVLAEMDTDQTRPDTERGAS
jgi:DNA-binding transcriptional ArsR family regulator